MMESSSKCIFYYFKYVAKAFFFIAVLKGNWDPIFNLILYMPVYKNNTRVPILELNNT